MMFYYNLDLAAVHCRLGGKHVGAHRNATLIESRLRHLLEPKLLGELLRVLVDSCPANSTHMAPTNNFERCLPTEITHP
jgi:hypothetical protein